MKSDKLIKKLRKNIKEKKLDAILIHDLFKILYLLDINDSYNLTELGLFLLITEKKIDLVGDPYTLSMVSVPEQINVVKENLKNFKKNRMRSIDCLKKLLGDRGVKKVGVLDRFNFNSIKEVVINDPFSIEFLFPDDSRIKILKENSKICRKVLEKTLKNIKSGINEIELRNEVDRNIYEFGGERRAFPTRVISGRFSANPFSVSNASTIDEGTPFFINFGIIKSGVGCEITRTFVMGEPDKEFMKIYRPVRYIYDKFVEFLKPGKITKEVYGYVSDMLKKKGYEDYLLEPLSTPLFPTGEGLIISDNRSSILRPGMNLCIQLNLYFPEKYGLRFQDMILLDEESSILTDFFNWRNKSDLSNMV